MSTTVVFYCLKRPEHNGKLRLTCNLANTAFKRGHNVYLSANSVEMCKMLDDMLWTFAPNSFVPHTIYDPNQAIDLDQYPVVIGYSPPSDKFKDVLISLHPDVPEFAGQFQRVIEPIDSSEEEQESAEKKFSRYTVLFGTEPTKHVL